MDGLRICGSKMAVGEPLGDKLPRMYGLALRTLERSLDEASRPTYTSGFEAVDLFSFGLGRRGATGGLGLDEAQRFWVAG
jgi:hypothetical protein